MRLRLIRDEKDIRLSKHELQAALDAWLPTLGKHVSTVTDRSYVWVFLSHADRFMPRLAFRVTRWTGAIHRVEGLVAERAAIGNVIDMR
jgi:hypothetical protein